MYTWNAVICKLQHKVFTCTDCIRIKMKFHFTASCKSGGWLLHPDMEWTCVYVFRLLLCFKGHHFFLEIILVGNKQLKIFFDLVYWIACFSEPLTVVVLIMSCYFIEEHNNYCIYKANYWDFSISLLGGTASSLV